MAVWTSEADFFLRRPAPTSVRDTPTTRTPAARERFTLEPPEREQTRASERRAEANARPRNAAEDRSVREREAPERPSNDRRADPRSRASADDRQDIRAKSREDLREGRIEEASSSQKTDERSKETGAEASTEASSAQGEADRTESVTGDAIGTVDAPGIQPPQDQATPQGAAPDMNLVVTQPAEIAAIAASGPSSIEDAEDTPSEESASKTDGIDEPGAAQSVQAALPATVAPAQGAMPHEVGKSAPSENEIGQRAVSVSGEPGGGEPTGITLPNEPRTASAAGDAVAAKGPAFETILAGASSTADGTALSGLTSALPGQGPGAASATAATASVAQPVAAPVPIGAVPMTIGLRSLTGSSHFEIRLDPADLGRIDVSLDIDKDRGTVTTHLVVERVETLALLQRDAGSLQQALSQAGLDSSESGISLSLRGDGGSGGQGPNGQQSERRGGQTTAHPQDRRTTIDAMPLRTLRGLSGIDIRI